MEGKKKFWFIDIKKNSKPVVFPNNDFKKYSSLQEMKQIKKIHF